MKRGIHRYSKGKLDLCKGKPFVLGISSGKRAKEDCAKEDPISLYYLKLALKEAEKNGAETKLIDLRELKINPCKECYSTCPAQCRFNEETNQCDCYAYRVNWYDDITHRSDSRKSKEDKYSLSLVKNIGKNIVEEIKKSSREYGIYSNTV